MDFTEHIKNCEQISVQNEQLSIDLLRNLELQECQIGRIDRLRQSIDKNLAQSRHHISSIKSWLYSIFIPTPVIPDVPNLESTPLLEQPDTPEIVVINNITVKPDRDNITRLSASIMRTRRLAEEIQRALEMSNDSLNKINCDIMQTEKIDSI